MEQNPHLFCSRTCDNPHMIASNAWSGSGLETLSQNRRYVVGCPVVVLQPLLIIILAFINKPVNNPDE